MVYTVYSLTAANMKINFATEKSITKSYIMKKKLLIVLSMLLGSFAAQAVPYTQPVKVTGGLVEGVILSLIHI